MPACTYLTSVTSPPGFLTPCIVPPGSGIPCIPPPDFVALSVTHLLCVDSSGSVIRYQYPTTEDWRPSGICCPSPPGKPVWNEVKDPLRMPISTKAAARFITPEQSSSTISPKRNVISMFWMQECGYDLILPNYMSSSRDAHELAMWESCHSYGHGGGTAYTVWAPLALVPTSGK